jgi:Cupin/Bacterial regulatory helix-turn-helix proteins, AraC family
VCRLEIDGRTPIDIAASDFILIPDAQDFAMSAGDVEPDETREVLPVRRSDGSFRLGVPEAPVSARLVIGYCTFGSPETDLLLSLLPQLIHARGKARLSTLVELVSDETRERQPGREAILTRLLEVLLIEALRTTSHDAAPASLLRGLADQRLSTALHRMHENPGHPWTVAELAREAGLSRTVFFDRFRQVVGVSPMEHMT